MLAYRQHVTRSNHSELEVCLADVVSVLNPFTFFFLYPGPLIKVRFLSPRIGLGKVRFFCFSPLIKVETIRDTYPECFGLRTSRVMYACPKNHQSSDISEKVPTLNYIIQHVPLVDCIRI